MIRRGLFRRAMLAALGVLSFVAAGAYAHDELLSYVQLRTESEEWVLELRLDAYVTESFVAGKLPHLDSWLDRVNFEHARALLSEEAKTFFQIETGDRVLEPISADFLVELDDCIYTVRYPIKGDGNLTITHQFFDRLLEGHRTILDFIQPDGKIGEVIFSAEKPTAEVSLLGATSSPPISAAGADPAGPSRGWFSLTFFKIGIEHIVFGFDHLLFLAGLLVACRRPADILVIVTSFTLAHSITLSVAALGWWVPSAALVEPAIAASIVFVGIENLVRKDIGKGRAGLTFVFGLIHGFGFAGVLRGLGLGQDGESVVTPLFAFNVGIEAGQLALVALVLPGLLWVQRKSIFARTWTRPSLSLIITLFGLFWLLRRTVFST